MKIFISGAFLGCFLVGCNPAHPVSNNRADVWACPYRVNAPDTGFTMPKSLVEISALTLSPFADKLATVSDEKGDLFFINKYTGVVDTPSIHFAPDGDFEGLEFVGTTAYAIKSKGKLYEISNAATPAQKVIVHKTSLSKDDNIEGLGYDKKNNRLLLAAKGQKDVGESRKRIFAFDLATKTLVDEPVLGIGAVDFARFLASHKSSINDVERLSALVSGVDSSLVIGPSALAVHPLSGDIYLLSSVGKLLVVLSEKGVIKDIISLDKKVHVQPEGLTFDLDGTMYISNEGKNGLGKLYVFKMRVE
jgi:uncharacterized protein YjiK